MCCVYVCVPGIGFAGLWSGFAPCVVMIGTLTSLPVVCVRACVSVCLSVLSVCVCVCTHLASASRACGMYDYHIAIASYFAIWLRLQDVYVCMCTPLLCSFCQNCLPISHLSFKSMCLGSSTVRSRPPLVFLLLVALWQRNKSATNFRCEIVRMMHDQHLFLLICCFVLVFNKMPPFHSWCLLCGKEIKVQHLDAKKLFLCLVFFFLLLLLAALFCFVLVV